VKIAGKSVTEMRIEQGLSMRQLAERAGLSAGTVSQAERRGAISADSAKRIADVLGVHPMDLVDVPETPPASGLEAFFASQHDLAENALEALKGAEQAAMDGEPEYLMTFIRLATSSIRGISDAMGEAIEVERGNTS